MIIQRTNADPRLSAECRKAHWVPDIKRTQPLNTRCRYTSYVGGGTNVRKWCVHNLM